MESTQLGSSSAEDRSVKTAEALRALREKLGPRVESDCRSASDVQTDIIGRIFQIAEEMASEKSTEAQAAAQFTDEKLAQLQVSLAERDNIVSQLQAQLDELEQDRSRLQGELRQERSDAAELRSAECGECSDLREKLHVSEDRAVAAETSAEQLKTDAETTAKELAELRTWQESSVAQDEQTARLQEELTQVEQQRDAFSSEVISLTAERDTLGEELATVRCKLEQQIFDSVTSDSSLQAELDEAKTTISRLEEDISDWEARSQAGAAEAHEQSQEAQQELASLRQELESLTEELTNFQATTAQLHDEKQQWEELRETLTHQLEEAVAKSEQSATQFQEAQEQLGALPNPQAQAEELEKAQRMFELAQADAQKLKRELAELQEELAHRPEANEQESAELVSLRVERDDLAARVAELEEMPAQTVVDEDAQQQLADLQRRFEMAVDDLRQVKQEKAQLEEKLISASHGNAPAVDSGAMDWQSQKARLLATLESDEDDEDMTPERAEEKMSIQGTIEITDQIVAKKDREIAELLEQLSSKEEAKPKDISAEFCDQDEVIQAERTRLEQLQAEWREKVGSAELEISKQRAALARKESELKELMAVAQEAAADVSLSSDGKPRRRWLSALGLGEDEPKEQ